MISKRIKAVASYLEFSDNVIDIGCDHGYLGIYATKNKLVNKIILSDVSNGALSQAQSNIKKENLNIETYLSNGLDNIEMDNINTITISGMGTSTILDILLDEEKIKNVNKIILQSNNNLDELRFNMHKKGFFLVDETTVFEKGIWYVICLFKRGKKKLNKKEKYFGIAKKDKIDYYEYLLNQNKIIYKKIPKKKIKKRLNIIFNIVILSNLLKKCRSI